MKTWQIAALGFASVAGGYGLYKGLGANSSPAAITECDDGIWCDQYGLIVHQGQDGNPDGGDTAQREGWYWLGVWIRQNSPGMKPWTPKRKLNFDQVLDLLEKDHNGVFFRHPYQAPWNDPFSKEAGTSRDQLVPIIAAMAVWGKQDRLRRLWNALPEDLVGKHAFNGNWRNVLGKNGWNCTEVKQQSCSPSMDCSPQTTNLNCSTSRDDRDCSASKNTMNCTAKHDTRDCHGLGKVFCEAAKAAQNKIYESDKLACEAKKATINLPSDAEKRVCEVSKATQNSIYEADRAQCEANQGVLNAKGAGLKGLCETAKTSGKFSCEAYKQAAYQVCKMGNVFSGDLFGPEYISLFMRAMNRNPALPQPDLLLSPTLLKTGISGDAELLLNTHLRIGKSRDDRDDVGPDLNHIVALIMAKMRYSTPLSNSALTEYAKQRGYSYGSYLTQFYAENRNQTGDMATPIAAGIARGWKPGVSAVIGAVRWYHRCETGANPGLAELWRPILEKYFGGPAGTSFLTLKCPQRRTLPPAPPAN